MVSYKFKNKLRWLVPGAKVKRYVFVALAGLVLAVLAEFIIEKNVIRMLTFISGQLLMVYGVISIIARLWRSTPKGISNMTTADRMYKEVKLNSGPKVAALGGGTGLSSLLRAVKKITSNVTAIVTVADNGGNSGVLRKELGVLPPGDIRNCVIALSETEDTMDDLLNYRFKDGKLSGYCVGNLVLVALSDMQGGFLKGIQSASEVLAVTGQVLPVTLDNVHLSAQMDSGEIVEGEDLVGSAQREHGGYIKKVYLNPEKATALPEALEALKNADIITFGPGSLYTSILPNILVEGVIETIKQSKAVKIYISNLMTQPGETEKYDVFSHVKAIEEHAGEKLFDYILINNNTKIPDYLLERYKLEYAEPVAAGSPESVEGDYIIIADNLLENVDDKVRHSVEGLANAINKVYNKHRKSKGL